MKPKATCNFFSKMSTRKCFNLYGHGHEILLSYNKQITFFLKDEPTENIRKHHCGITLLRMKSVYQVMDPWITTNNETDIIACFTTAMFVCLGRVYRSITTLFNGVMVNGKCVIPSESKIFSHK